MRQVIECVPNFSEGRDPEILRQITAAVEEVDGAELLDVDPGAATNRTVVTFAGEPAAVVEAAVRAARRAAELIDMRKHQGEHPRFGAMDVCPLVPISGITMEETVEHARTLARRLGEEVGLSIYCYENAATRPERRNLAEVRAGEYEGLAARLKDPKWAPDFGPAEFQPRTGATAVGARDFLIAYNVNLNTTSVRRANSVAFDVRETGRVKRAGGRPDGEVQTDENGEPLRTPGKLKCVKGIGWFIEEYGIAQISMNLTNIRVTPLHVAFDETARCADARGLRVTGSELVGLVPLSCMLDAGRYFLQKQRRSLGVSDAELIKIAVRSMGLDELSPFDPAEKIIEYKLRDPAKQLLVERTLRGFVEATAAESPAPGGGSVSAAVGAMGAALGTMVANLSAVKYGSDERWEEYSRHAESGKALHDELIRLTDADTDAFDAILAAVRMPKASEDEQAIRAEALREATKGAIEVPLQVMRTSLKIMDLVEVMVEKGLPSSLSDAAVGALCARTAVLGAQLNVQINCKDLDDAEAVSAYLAEAEELGAAAVAREEAILRTVRAKP